MLIVFIGHVALFYDFTPVDKQGPFKAFLSINAGTGVDLFFVLSGFLITGILLDAKGQDRFFRNFYARRTLRIFPIYYTALIIVLVTSALAPHLEIWKGLTSASQLANWTYTTNILMATREWKAEPVILGHFWSLSVEEQFYLIWPLIVFAFGRRWLLAICGTGVIAAFLFRAALVIKGHSVGAYTLLPARMDCLLAGAMLAILIRRRYGLPRWIAGRAAILTTLAIFALDQFTYQRALNVPPGRVLPLSPSLVLSGRMQIAVLAIHYTVTSAAFAVLLASAVDARRWILARMLSSSPLRFFGRYSYSIYIFHLAIIVGLGGALRRVFPNIFLFGLGALGVSVVVALLSWNIVEHPFLKLKDRFRSRPSVTPKVVSEAWPEAVPSPSDG